MFVLFCPIPRSPASPAAIIYPDNVRVFFRDAVPRYRPIPSGNRDLENGCPPLSSFPPGWALIPIAKGVMFAPNRVQQQFT